MTAKAKEAGKHIRQPVRGELDLRNEQGLLGDIITTAYRHRDIFDKLATMVDAGDFSCTAFGRMFGILQDMYYRGEPVHEVNAIRTRIIEDGLYEEIGGAEGLGKLAINVTGNPLYSAKLVRSGAHRRRIHGELHAALAELDLAGADHYAIAAKAASAMSAIVSRREVKFESAAEIAGKIVHDLDRPARPMVFSGLPKFDQEIGGFVPGELVVLAARTSMGKTALAAQIAEHNGHRNRPVLFITLEMEGADIVRRILARNSGAGVKQLRAGGLSSNLREEVRAVAGDLQACTLYPYYMPAAKACDIRNVAKAFSIKHGIALLVVDYLQIIARPDSRMNMRETVSDATRTLKQLAGELSCPVLALSQLNRESTKMQAPTLAQLAESASIEADADMVLAIHRESPQHKVGKLLVLKNRNGEALDLAGLQWNGSRMEYSFG